MTDQSEETIEEEEMARQFQEPEQTARAVAQPLQETRAENTQMLQGSSLTAAGDRVLHSATMIQQLTSSGSSNLVIINPQNCQIIAPKRPAATGSEQQCLPPKIPKLDDSSQAAASGRSLQPQTPDDGSVQGANPAKDPTQVTAESCKEALKTHYTTTGSYVPLIPWEDGDSKHIKDIFTELTLEKFGKKLESYKDIFLQTTREGNPIKRVILKGSAGRGKSTIMDKMTYDWACGEALQQFELVFLLRMSAVEQRTELIDSIFGQLLAEDTKIDKGALGSFIRDNEEKVLILLDGFDELMTPMYALLETLFGSILKTLNRKRGRDCYVVVTTRTSHYHKLVTKSLIQEPFTQVRVAGFDEEDIKKYAEKFYSEEHDKAKRLIQRIKSSNVLSELAKSPMLLLFMCILWRDKSTLPETMSRLYSEALEYIFRRKHGMSPDEKSEVTNELGKIGLHGLLAPEQQLTFHEEVFKPRVLEFAIKAGILTSQRVLKGIRSHDSFQFLHKTFQECCAGKYLQSLLETDTMEFKKNLKQMINSKDRDFEYVFRFCAGDSMACTSSILQTLAESDQFKEEPNIMRITILMLLGLNCYFEGQSKDLPAVEFIQTVLTDHVDINFWDSDSLYSFTYFLRIICTHSMENNRSDYLDKVQSVWIDRCHLSRHISGLPYFMSFMVNLSSVTLSSCKLYDISEESAAVSGATSDPNGSAALWALNFKKMKNLQKLTLSHCSLTGGDMTHIAPALCDLPNLVELNLWGNKALGGFAASWANHFKKIKKLRKLTLNYCSLIGEDMTHIAPALCDLPKLVELDLWGNKALGGTAALWANHFKKMKNLQKLTLSHCSLTGEDMTQIALALCYLIILVELDLWGNDALGGSAALWVHHVKKMKNLQKLTLSDCSLTGEDMKQIAPALCDLPNLVELSLRENKALGGSAAAWAHPFKKMKNLQELTLSWCSLTNEDMTYIAPALCDLTNLGQLNLGRNKTLGGSAAPWVHYFKKMKSLQKLTLNYCSLTGEDMTHIASELADLPNLVELNLLGNDALSGCAASWVHQFKKIKNLRLNTD